jgi:hypothetical protein
MHGWWYQLKHGNFDTIYPSSPTDPYLQRLCAYLPFYLPKPQVLCVLYNVMHIVILSHELFNVILLYCYIIAVTIEIQCS